MEEKILNPDYLFEVSWEICNKIGGIHSVLSSKTLTTVDFLNDRYILVGPDVWRDEEDNKEFIEDSSLFPDWRQKAHEEGLRTRTGRWRVPGKPLVVLVDFTTFIPSKDNIFSDLWESHKLDSITGQWDYIEPSLFGYAAGKIIESFTRFNISHDENVAAHFHEWKTGTGLLYLNKQMKRIATLFTTHSTLVGSALAASSKPLYSKPGSFNADKIAREYNIVSKQSLETMSAKYADCFTTVSEITATECTRFLGKSPDLITPNGFEPRDIPDNLQARASKSRSKLLKLAATMSQSEMPDNTFIMGIGARFEIKNKGIDLFIEALNGIRNQKPSRQVLAFIFVPTSNFGPNQAIVKSFVDGNGQLNEPAIVTHNLQYPNTDIIYNTLIQNNFLNHPGDKVKVVYVPTYLEGDDGIFNQPYPEILSGLDISVQPSYYEPWGYAAMQSLCYKVPAITTNVSGFGKWITGMKENKSHALHLIDRLQDNSTQVAREISEHVQFMMSMEKKSLDLIKEEAFSLVQPATWENFRKFYQQAYHQAIQKVKSRPKSVLEEERIDKLTTLEKPVVANQAVWKRFRVIKHVPEKLKALDDISKNLWWCWNHEAIDLFKSIDGKLWDESEENPIVFLEKISYETYQKLEKDENFLNKLDSVASKLNQYLGAPKNKENPSIAYFSMEYGLHDSLKIFSGGLGLLAGDYLKEASDSNYDITGVGILYRYGYFKQVISTNGDQVANYEPQEFSNIPVEPARDEDGNWITVGLVLPGRTLSIRVWKAQVGRISLYLLDTDFEANNEQDRTITHQLYGGDLENRLKQELLLGIGGIRALRKLGIDADLYHCNEGHAAFINIERMRDYITQYNMPFDEAREVIRASSLFTTHTPVPAGHDFFDENLLRMYISHYPQRLQLTWDQLMNLGKAIPGNPNERFSMSFLAANFSQEINGVSKLHGKVSQEIFKELYRGYYPEELHINYVTNGVHFSSWIAKEWLELYLKEFGSDFLENQMDNSRWEKIHAVKDEKIWKLRTLQRGKLINYIKQRLKLASIKRFENPRHTLEIQEKLDPDVLTIGFARRFATYKRAGILFTDLDRLSEIVNNPEMPVQFVFAGKAHPQDKAGQDLIKHIVEVSKMPRFTGKIIFLQNYDIGLAKKLVQGVDIWLNTPTRPLEASGTSGEKAVMNGVLHFSVLDGWWAEGYMENAGWALPEERTYENQDFQNQLDVETLYSILENEICPLFYDRNKQGVPEKWIQFIKNSIAGVAPRFTMNRMLNDYHGKFYTKMFARKKSLQENNFETVKQITGWKKKIYQHWDHISIMSVKYPDFTRDPVILGREYPITVIIEFNDLEPKDIGVEIVVADLISSNEGNKILYRQELKLEVVKENYATYSTKYVPVKTGSFDLGIRLFPKNDLLPHRQDFNIVRWV
jgi:phosphorylase/glycogen(starch) synthase